MGATLRAGLAALSLGLAGAVYRLDLAAPSTGANPFPGGDNEATCKACKAVMEHVGRRLDEPFDAVYFGDGRRGWDAKGANRVAHIESVLEPSSCTEEMAKYDLAYIRGQHVFHYRGKDPEAAEVNYPVHMELNEVAKHELGKFCESLFEEREEELHEMLKAEERTPESNHCADLLHTSH